MIYVLEIYELNEHPPRKDVKLSKMYKNKPSMDQIISNFLHIHPEYAEGFIQNIGNNQELNQIINNDQYDVQAGDLRLRLFKEYITMR